MCGGRSSILHYGPQIETNKLYVPTPNGQKPACVAKQTQYPPPRSPFGIELPLSADLIYIEFTRSYTTLVLS